MMSLAIVYAGAALAPKMLTSGVAGRCPALISMILVDQVEQVQLLALVLMQALGLDVEHCIRVNGDTLRAVQPVGQCALVLRLDGGELLQNIDIFRVGQQFFKLGGVLAETGTDELFDLGGQCRVALQQPAAEGDAVGLIVEFFGVELVKAVQLAVSSGFRCADGQRRSSSG